MKLAIIGASRGQLPICLKSKEMGIETICFAWSEGAVCKDFVNKFYPISIFEMDKIADICKEEHVDGVVSNASEKIASVVSYVAGKLALHATPYDAILSIKNKFNTRQKTGNISELRTIQCVKYTVGQQAPFIPCVVKPISGAGKQGVSFVHSEDEFKAAINYINGATDSEIIVEEYIEGAEVSVESISFEGKHYVIQVTDKENSGPPHFVELSHHQPSSLNPEVIEKIKRIIPNLLTAVGFTNGASHTEMKIDASGNVYLIEINPRGGGDEISNTLVELSTGYDYIKGMIEVALGTFTQPTISKSQCAGIYFLCEQTKSRIPFFVNSAEKDWLVRSNFDIKSLSTATGNSDRNGSLIYCAPQKINWQDYL